MKIGNGNYFLEYVEWSSIPKVVKNGLFQKNPNRWEEGWGYGISSGTYWRKRSVTQFCEISRDESLFSL